jgi:hypothetical protein
MCTCAATNAGAVLSVSTVLDGELIDNGCGGMVSSGGANSIGVKAKIQPKVWQYIQESMGLRFLLLETEDSELVELSRRIFEDYREAVDQRLAARFR